MSEEKDNLALWDSVAKTDSRYHKPVRHGEREYTSIDAYYSIRKATAKFGPFGRGWGLRGSIRTEHLDQHHVLAVWEGTFWWEGTAFGGGGEFPIVCAVEALGVRKRTGEVFVDPDAVKKAETGAISKGLSYLGFDAEVYLNEHQDAYQAPSTSGPAQDPQHIGAAAKEAAGEPKELDKLIPFGKYKQQRTWRQVTMSEPGYIQFLLDSAYDQPGKYQAVNIERYTALLEWRDTQMGDEPSDPPETGDNSPEAEEQAAPVGEPPYDVSPWDEDTPF